MNLYRPIGIFDAGIGSYAIVERVRARFPDQDILYFADRASFPYGAKSPAELLACVLNTTQHLIDCGCVAVVLGSNAPSVVVLDKLRNAIHVPVIGVFPPVREAMQQSRSKKIAILGVRSMVRSDSMFQYIQNNVSETDRVLLVNASSLVDLVEDFSFLSDPAGTQVKVEKFIAELRNANPEVDVMTLSSTHLPWLRPFFETAAPEMVFLDPAETILDELSPLTATGSGRTYCIATETPNLPIEQINMALKILGAAFRAELPCYLKNT